MSGALRSGITTERPSVRARPFACCVDGGPLAVLPDLPHAHHVLFYGAQEDVAAQLEALEVLQQSGQLGGVDFDHEMWLAADPGGTG